MLQWQFSWGDKVAQLESVAETTGVLPPALQNRPSLLSHLAYAWNLFSELGGCRTTTGPSLPTPIQLTEFLAYARLFQFTRLQTQQLWKRVSLIDRLWLRELADRQEADRKSSAAKAKKRG